MSSRMPVKQITFLNPYSAQASMESRVALMTRSWYFGLLNPLTNGRVGAHVDRADGAREAGLLEQRVVLGRDQLDAAAAELLGDLDRLRHVPVLREAPVDDRLLDPPVLDGAVAGWSSCAMALLPSAVKPSTAAPAVCLSISRRLLRPGPFWTLPD